MATRLYPNDIQGSMFDTPNVAVAGTWNASSTNAKEFKGLYKEKVYYGGYGYGYGVRAEAETSATNNYDVLLTRFITKPLLNNVSFTTSDTVSWVLAVKESNTSANMYYKVHITVVKPDGTIRGTLLSNNVGSTEWTTTSVGRGEGTKTLSAVSALAGDWLLVEVGYRAANTSTTSYTGTLNYGADSTTTDLTQGTTYTSGLAGWIEFSNNFDFVDTLYWVGGSGDVYDIAHWSATSGGTGGVAIPIGQIYNLVFDANSFSSNGSVVNIDLSPYLGFVNLDMTGVNKTVTIDTSFLWFRLDCYGTYFRINDFVTIGGTAWAELYFANVGERYITQTSVNLSLGNNSHIVNILSLGNGNDTDTGTSDIELNLESPIVSPDLSFNFYPTSYVNLIVNTNNYNLSISDINPYYDTIVNFGTSTLSVKHINWTDDTNSVMDTEDAKLVLNDSTSQAYYGLVSYTVAPHWAEVEVTGSLDISSISDISTDKFIINENIAVNIYSTLTSYLELGDVVLQKNSYLLIDPLTKANITSLNTYGNSSEQVLIGGFSYNDGLNYHFDGHTAISDPNSVWTDDSNAANGNNTNYAYTSTVGSTSSNYLEISGTNITSSTHKVFAVKVKVSASSSDGTNVYFRVAVYDQDNNYVGQSDAVGVIAQTDKTITLAISGDTKPYYTSSELSNFKVRAYKTSGTASVRLYSVKIYGVSPHETSTTDINEKYYIYNTTNNESLLYGANVYNLVAGGNYLFGRENIEGGAIPATLTVSNSGSTTYTLDTASKVAGEYSIKHTASGTGNIYNGKVLDSDATELYVKYKVFLPSSFSVGSTGYVEIAHINNNSDTTSIYAELRNSSGNIRLFIKGDAITSIDTGINLTQDAVNNLQFYFKKSATVGVVKVWKDNDTVNSPDYDSGNINTGTVALRKVYFGKYYSPDANSDIWIDDLVISQSFILETPKFLAIDAVAHAGDSGLDYLTSSEEDVTKTVDYEVLYMPEMQKTAQYTIIEDYGITKSGDYNVAMISTIGLDGTYEIISTPIQKTFMYKVYDSAGNFLNTWTDVVTDFTYRQEINMVGAEAQLTLARKADDFGEGVDVAHNNRVEVYVVDKEEPNGLLIFVGRISAYTANFNSEVIDVTLLSYGAELNEIIITDVDGKTIIPLLSQDPSDIFKTIIDDYAYAGGTAISYDGTTIDDTSTTVSYTFNAYTAKEALDKALELTPVDWYFYLDLATNKIHLHEKGTTADHIFAIGRDVAELTITKRSETIVNTVYFVGGDISGGVGDPINLYKKYTIPASITQYGVRSKRVSDQRVLLEATADIIAQRYLQGSPEILVTVSIIDSNQNSKGYDLETIKLGDLVKIGNAGIGPSSVYDEAEYDSSPYDYDPTNLSSIVFQVTSKEYTGDKITLNLSTTPPDITKRIQDINRNLIDLQTKDNPDTPDV